MKIRFGWLMDGAQWVTRSQQSGKSTHGGTPRICAGPHMLISILLTRLGLQHPSVEHPIRIAQYRKLALEAHHPWYAASLERDPWNTARTLLALRDEAIEMGWDPSRKKMENIRLQALQEIERRVRVGSIGMDSANLAPGYADDIAEVHSELAAHASGAGWSLGIESIECLEDPAILPGRWPKIFALLASLGVDVHTAEQVDQLPQSVRIIRAPQEFTAAETAARQIHQVLDEHADLTVLATSDTLVLDTQLVRRGLPPVSHVPATRTGLGSQILPVFLAAATAPVDVHALLTLLSITIPRDVAPVDAKSEDDALSLFPPFVTQELLGALGNEAGADTSDPDSLFSRALTRIEEKGTYGEHLERMRELCGTWSRSAATPGTQLVTDLRAKLDLLTRILKALPASASQTRSLVNSHLSLLTRLLDLTPKEQIGERELHDLILAAAPLSSSVLSRESVTPWHTATHEAHVNGGHILWWGSYESTAPVAPWDPAEQAELETVGARIHSAEQMASLNLGIKQRALCTAESLTIVIPTVVRGEKTRINPAIPALAGQWASAHPELIDSASRQEDILKQISVTSHEIARELLSAGALTACETWIPERPKSLTRRVQPGMHLMPQSLSFSQLEGLHRDAMGWLLRYPFGIKPGNIASVPTGNRMVGILVHALIERLVEDARLAAFTIPSDQLIREHFDSLVPRYAAELNLPGKTAERAAILSKATRSVRELFAVLKEAEIRVDRIEYPIEDLQLSLKLATAAGPARHTVDFNGFVDFIGTGKDGERVIIDFKWTNSTGRYWDYVRNGTALQLATYAWALSAKDLAPTEPRAGFFMLNQSEFVSLDPALAHTSAAPVPLLPLWQRLITTIEGNLSLIAQGTVTSDLGEIAIATAPEHSNTAHKNQAKKFATELSEQGKVFVDTNAAYSDYALITGITGDYS